MCVITEEGPEDRSWRPGRGYGYCYASACIFPESKQKPRGMDSTPTGILCEQSHRHRGRDARRFSACILCNSPDADGRDKYPNEYKVVLQEEVTSYPATPAVLTMNGARFCMDLCYVGEPPFSATGNLRPNHMGCSRSELAASYIEPLSFPTVLPTSIENHETTSNMSAQAAGRAVNAATKAASKTTGDHVLNKGAKRDPELYVRTHSLQKLRILSNRTSGSSSMFI